MVFLYVQGSLKYTLSRWLQQRSKIVSPDGKVAAYVDDDSYAKTFHTADCELLCPCAKCESCKAYRANLRSIYNRWSKQCGFKGSDTSSHTNDRYLNTTEEKKSKNPWLAEEST